MVQQSHEVAAASRAEEAAILGGKSRRVVICGREYTFLEPSRRDNRLMFADLARVQALSSQKESRVKALMAMLDFLIDWHPQIAADETKIDDALRAELGSGGTKTSVEIVTAWKEVAAMVARPFQHTQDSPETAASST